MVRRHQTKLVSNLYFQVAESRIHKKNNNCHIAISIAATNIHKTEKLSNSNVEAFLLG